LSSSISSKSPSIKLFLLSCFFLNLLENLFIKNFDNIIKKKYKIKKLNLKGTFHYKKNLPKNFKNWNQVINEYLKNQLK